MSQTSVQIRKMPVSTQICIILLCLIINFVNICLGVYSLIFKLVVFPKSNCYSFKRRHLRVTQLCRLSATCTCPTAPNLGWEAAASGGGEGPVLLLMKFEREFGRDMASAQQLGSGQQIQESAAAPQAVNEVADLMRRHEGQLSKFTNVVKGWQYRWFVLDPESGNLEYFLMDERGGRSRGKQHLAGAVVVPSEEDGHTFSINFGSGEVYKVRASQTRERQVWVDRLRACSHRHGLALGLPRVPGRDRPITPPGAKSHVTGSEPSDQLQSLSLSALDAFGSVHDMLHRVEEKHRSLSEAIEALPPGREREEERGTTSVQPHCHDPKLLLLKATSQSTLLAMEGALSLLQQLREDQLASGTTIVTSSPSLPHTPSSPSKSIS